MLSKSLLASFITIALAASPHLSPTVIHERRAAAPPGWVSRGTHAADAAIPLRFGMKQQNLDKLDAMLHAISHPDSPTYGQHMSASEVAETFAPAQESVDVVMAWLDASGVHPDRLRVAASRTWITFNATVAEAEQLLATEYDVYEHTNTGTIQVACQQYSLPQHLKAHVDLVTPTVSFDRRVDVARPLLRRPFNAKKDSTGGSESLAHQLKHCDSTITPACLRALSIAEYTPQAYVPEDLDLFYANYSKEHVGQRPKLVSIAGGVVQTTDRSIGVNAESALDIVYAQSLVGSLEVSLYQTGDIVQTGTFNNMLDALDGTYCTYEGGDDPTRDGIYPNESNEPGAYKGKDCGTVKPAYVIATSYFYQEADLTQFYMARQCNEYGKLGLMGTTVIYCTGDWGAGARQDLCLAPNGTLVPGGKIFSPAFPASCPYVTAVGATQVPAGRTILDPEAATYEEIASGGGFSNLFDRPKYQQTQVKSFFQNHRPTYPRSMYNESGRGFPDISANGANYILAVDGTVQHVFGTSASAPVIGAMIASINDARLAVGKSPVGFINPALYSASFAGAYNDITNGTNPGCGTSGYNATKGWDPVTGLSTPRFPILLKKFMSLP